MPLSAVGIAIPWREAYLLAQELTRETGSHFHANLHKLLFASSQADRASITLAAFVINGFRDKKQFPAPFTLAHPYETTEEPQATDEEVEQARAVLKENSMFGDR